MRWFGSSILVKDGGKKLQPGDIIQYTLNAKGEIDGITVLFDITAKDTEFYKSYGSADEMAIVYGKVTKKFTDNFYVYESIIYNDGKIFLEAYMSLDFPDIIDLSYRTEKQRQSMINDFIRILIKKDINIIWQKLLLHLNLNIFVLIFAITIQSTKLVNFS